MGVRYESRAMGVVQILIEKWWTLAFPVHFNYLSPSTSRALSLDQNTQLTSPSLPGDETREGTDFHTEMEARLKMDW